MNVEFEFSEENILRLFGNEAAENEPLARLREYYIKNNVYNQVVCDIPLRILVGHKGIGKSALLKFAIHEDEENGLLPILIKPDDILGLASTDKSMLELIRDWKVGLVDLVGRKCLENFGVQHAQSTESLQSAVGKTVNFIADTLRKVRSELDLSPAKERLIDLFLKRRRITVFLDDLDRGWESKQLDIKRISALLNAVRDLSSDNPGLQFRIALRSDVYFLVRTSDESTDKIESSVIWYSWTNHEILILLIKRIETFFGRRVDETELLVKKQPFIAGYLKSVFEPRFTGRGHWANAPMHRVLMSLIRKRPRDLVKLCTAAARVAHSKRHSIIKTTDLEDVFQEYSQGRIQDAINEYKSELPDIARLVMGMKPNKKERIARSSYCFSTDELLKKIDNIQQSGKFRFANRVEAGRKELAQFLYKINFLTARKELPDGLIERKYFEESRYLSTSFADFGYKWEIHPAYRWALQPDSFDDLFRTIELSSDD
ncbi:ATP-binding protein [candidate division KSB1 bacterium]|nr:ATP-binding protein [bacterium]NUM65566.1 ATP-binding protein [candidate division KSB1 bacterium]